MTSNTTHLHIGRGFVACTQQRWGENNRWVKNNIEDVTCKVCRRVKKSTIDKRKKLIAIEEIMCS